MLSADARGKVIVAALSAVLSGSVGWVASWAATSLTLVGEVRGTSEAVKRLEARMDALVVAVGQRAPGAAAAAPAEAPGTSKGRP